MFDKIIKLIIFVSLLAYGVNVSLNRFDIIFFQCAVMLIFFSSIFSKPVRDFPYKIHLVSLAGLVLLNFILHGSELLQMLHLIKIFFGLMAFYIIYRYIGDIKSCFKFAIYAALINITMLGLNYLGSIPLKETLENGGLMGNAPRLATLLGLLLPFSGWFSILFIAISFLVKEYTILLVCFYFCMKYFKTIREKILLSMVFILGCTLLYQPLMYSITTRWNLWKPILDNIYLHPYIGFGLGSLVGDTVLSSFILLAFQFGITGLAVVIWVLKEIPAIPLIIFMILEYPIEIPRLWLLITIVMAYYAIKKQEERGVC